MRFVLAHSPVVGPATWRWVADALRVAGHDPVVPNLVGAALTGEPTAFARAAVVASDSDEAAVLVGHSGAGAILPLVAAGLTRWPRLLVFVDAGVPPCEGAFTAGGDHLEELRSLSTNGILPRWSEWFGDDVMAALVPDDQRRQTIERELPEVPLGFYSAPIDVPAGWCGKRGAYVLLSDAYRPDAAKASSLGWEVVERLGGHLDIVNDGDSIAGILVNLADRL